MCLSPLMIMLILLFADVFKHFWLIMVQLWSFRVSNKNWCVQTAWHNCMISPVVGQKDWKKSYSFLALITSLVLCVKAQLKSFFSIYVLSKKQKHLQKNFHLVCYSGNNNLKLCVFSLYILVIIITVFVHEVLV